VGLVLAVVCMVSGVALVLGGVRRLRGLPVGAGMLVAICLASLVTALYFGVWAPDARWRIGLLSLLLAALAVRLTFTAWGEARAPFHAGMRLLALLGVVFAAHMGLRAVAAALGQIETTVIPTPLNAASVLAAGMSLIGGVVGLVLLISGDLLAQVEQQRTHDPLTGLLNRQGLRQWVGAQAAQAPVALGMVDLDHFKQINDLHGHGMGDQVIRHLAALLQPAKPTVAAPRAWGVRSLWVVALGAGHGTALLQMLEQLRQQFAEGAPHAGATLSAGWAQGTVAGFEATLREADAALYRAKEAGRNRVETAFSAAA
jgi:diguanylate cyclase (GGDEF)-like protein